MFARKLNFKTVWHNQTNKAQISPEIKWSRMDYKMLKVLTQLEMEGGVWDDPKIMHQMLTDTEDTASPVLTTPLE